MKAYNLTEFQKAAAEFVLGLKPVPHRATVVGLYGELGAGKTAFVQAAAKALGVSEPVNSPTFLIVKKYQLSEGNLSPSSEGEIERGCFKRLIHIDIYRLTHSGELRALGFTGFLADSQNLIFVEWAERVADLLPPDHIKLYFEFVDDTIRQISSS